MVPVAIVHVCCQSARCLWQVGRVLLDAAVIGKALDEDDVFSVRRKLEPFYLRGIVGELLAVGTVGIHAPHLSVGKKRDALSAFNPRCIRFVLCRGGELAFASTVGIHDAKHLVSFVLFYAVVANLIDNLFAIG